MTQKEPHTKGKFPPAKTRPENLKEQGQPGNITQNTTNQGHQQDR